MIISRGRNVFHHCIIKKKNIIKIKIKLLFKFCLFRKYIAYLAPNFRISNSFILSEKKLLLKISFHLMWRQQKIFSLQINRKSFQTIKRKSERQSRVCNFLHFSFFYRRFLRIVLPAETGFCGGF